MEVEGIHNYYENQVIQRIGGMPDLLSEFDISEMSDIVCIALNQLPSKYYRHSVDLNFYTSTLEQEKIDQEITKAIAYAARKVRNHPRIPEAED